LTNSEAAIQCDRIEATYVLQLKDSCVGIYIYL